MPLEPFNYVDDLVTTNPDVNDGLVNGDDHIRGIKLALKNTFPAASGALTRALSAGWGFLAGDGSKSTPGLAFASEPSLGFYRSGAGEMRSAGRLVGLVPAGFILPFGGLTAPEGWLPCDGQTINTADYPDLFAAIGYTWGGSGAQFKVPPMGSRFPRHREASGASGPVGTLQAQQLGSHAHTASMAAAGAHSHIVSGMTSGVDRTLTHGHEIDRLASVWPVNVDQASSGPVAWSPNGRDYPRASTLPMTAELQHAHPFSGVSDTQGSHAHAITVNASGGTETRPDSISLTFCIKT